MYHVSRSAEVDLQSDDLAGSVTSMLGDQIRNHVDELLALIANCSHPREAVRSVVDAIVLGAETDEQAVRSFLQSSFS